MKPALSQMAVMNVEKGEEIIGGWVTPKIPQVGIYKLLAKQRLDGNIEWAHFVQRESGLKENVTRGEVKDRAQLEEVLEIMNRNLHRIFGVKLVATDYNVYTVDGKEPPGLLQ